jgi:hypothetical protein
VRVVVEMRALLCRVASVFAWLAWASHASASPPPRVIVVARAPREPRIERALLLIRGELAGVGLSAEIRETPEESAPVSSDVYGLVSLEEQGAVTEIRAFAPGDPKPIVASVDSADADVDAEVIAVRAVETLRAAVLQFAQTHEAGLPDAVRGFAQLPEATRPEAHAPPQPPLHPTTPALQGFLGPELAWHPHLMPSLGAQGGLIVGPRWGFVAASFESTLYRSRVNASAGHADIARRMLSLEFGARFRLARVWEVTTRAGAGYASYGVRGEAEPGYLAASVDHQSVVLSLAVGGAYYFGRALGVYLDVGGGVALDAPNVRIAGEDQSTLDRPSLVVSSGMLVAIF